MRFQTKQILHLEGSFVVQDRPEIAISRPCANHTNADSFQLVKQPTGAERPIHFSFRFRGRTFLCERSQGNLALSFHGGDFLLEKGDALHAGDLKSFSAAHVLAHHHVVSPQHVRLCLGEFCAVPIIRPRRQIFLLHPDQPLDLIFRRLVAVRTT